MTYEPTTAQANAACAAWAAAVPWTRENAMAAALDAAGHVPPGTPRAEAVRRALAGYDSGGDGTTSPMQRALAAAIQAAPAGPGGSRTDADVLREAARILDTEPRRATYLSLAVATLHDEAGDDDGQETGR